MAKIEVESVITEQQQQYIEDVIEPDRADGQLAALGHKSELKRTHTFWSLMAYQTTILCSWSCNIVLYSYIFTLGGPASLIWGTVIVTIGQTLVMTSLAEYCSIWPTAGGTQFYTQIVAPESCRRFLSYLVGWCILVGEISTSASCALNSAQIVAAFVAVTNPEVEWKPYMTWLIYSAFLVMPFVVNLAPKLLPGFQLFGAAFNIGGALVWAIVFLVMAPKTSAQFIFTEFINTSGWSNNGWVFVLSMYVPIYGLYGSDGVMHLTEEMKRPARDAPRVMIWSMIWAGTAGFIFGVIMCYTVGPNWDTYLAAESSYLAWFMGVTNSVVGGGVFCAVLMMGLNFLIIVNMNAAGSRVIWTMARDNAFPWSSYLRKVSNRFDVPLRAMVVFQVFNLLTGLLVFGSDLAFYAIISGGGVALQISYCVPILCVVCRGRSILPSSRSFDLGKTRGYVINVVGLLWSILVLMFYIFPQYLPIIGDIANMNWAIAIIGGVVVLNGVYWALKGRKEYLRTSNAVLEETVVVYEDQVLTGREILQQMEKPVKS